jgi:hypothetical protein
MARKHLQNKVRFFFIKRLIIILHSIICLRFSIYKINLFKSILFFPIERAEWTKVEEEMFGDDPEKLKWARGGEAIDVRPRN